jgi:hypothetical protein
MGYSLLVALYRGSEKQKSFFTSKVLTQVSFHSLRLTSNEYQVTIFQPLIKVFNRALRIQSSGF